MHIFLTGIPRLSQPQTNTTSKMKYPLLIDTFMLQTPHFGEKKHRGLWPTAEDGVKKGKKPEEIKRDMQEDANLSGAKVDVTDELAASAIRSAIKKHNRS